MKISMSPRAHYVTQTSVWDNPRTGNLTDAKIRKYIREGRYGEEARLRAERAGIIREARLVRKNTMKAKTKALMDLLFAD